VTLLTLLGSTGSIGTSTLDVVRRWPERFGIFALVAGRNTELLALQIEEFRPKVVVVADEAALNDLRARLGSHVCELAFGAQARIDAARAP
jgi:1-deoxy-D-xylulose-5-phosphate reductoisomerase